MPNNKSDSALIRHHSAQLANVLTISKPALLTLTRELYSASVLSDMEKIEITEELSMTSADKLVRYIISRIDKREHCDKIWKELDKVEALMDIVEKMKLEKGWLVY